MDLARPTVAFDVTPLLGFRTGMGLSTEGMWSALGALDPGPVLRPYAIGVDAPPGILPAGTRHIRLPTRALIRVWSRTNRLSMDRWLPPSDVVHATNFTVGPTARPTLLTVQDIGFALFPDTADTVTRTFPGMLRRAIGRGAHVHVTTRHLAEQVDAYFGPGLLSAGRLTVVPLGIPDLGPPGVLPGAVVAGLGGRPYVLALGSQERRKNLPVLIDAFGRAAGDLDDLCLVLAGPDGAGTPAVTAAVAALPAAVRTRVIRAGPVGTGERRALLDGADVLAYPSLYEGFGLPPLEAMSVGVPALVSRAGAVAEVAGPAAEVVDPGDVDGWADGLHRLVGDSARRQELIDAGRRHAATFTWAATATGLARVYDRLATSS